MVRLTYFLEPTVSEAPVAVPSNLAFAAAAAARASWASKHRGDDIRDVAISGDGVDNERAPVSAANEPVRVFAEVVINARPSSGIMPQNGLKDAAFGSNDSSGGGGWVADGGNPHHVARNSVLYHTVHDEQSVAVSLLPPTKLAPSVVAVASVLEGRKDRTAPAQPGRLQSFLSHSSRMLVEATASPFEYTTIEEEVSGSEAQGQGQGGMAAPSSAGEFADHRKSLYDHPPSYVGRAAESLPASLNVAGVGGAASSRLSGMIEGLPSYDVSRLGEEDSEAYASGCAADGDGDGDGERDGCLVLPVLRTLLELQGDPNPPKAPSAPVSGSSYARPSAANLPSGHPPLASSPSVTFSRQPSSQHFMRSSLSQHGPTHGGTAAGGASAAAVPRQNSVGPALAARRRGIAASGAGDASVHGPGRDAHSGGGGRIARQPYSRSFHSVCLMAGPVSAVLEEEDQLGDLEPVGRAFSCSASPSTTARGGGTVTGRQTTKRSNTATGFTLGANGNVSGGAGSGGGNSSSSSNASGSGGVGGEGVGHVSFSQSMESAGPSPARLHPHAHPPQQAPLVSHPPAVHSHPPARSGAGAGGKSPSPKRLFSWTQGLGKGKWFGSGSDAAGGAGGTAGVGAGGAPSSGGAAGMAGGHTGAHTADVTALGVSGLSIQGCAATLRSSQAGGGAGGGPPQHQPLQQQRRPSHTGRINDHVFLPPIETSRRKLGGGSANGVHGSPGVGGGAGGGQDRVELHSPTAAEAGLAGKGRR